MYNLFGGSKKRHPRKKKASTKGGAKRPAWAAPLVRHLALEGEKKWGKIRENKLSAAWMRRQKSRTIKGKKKKTSENAKKFYNKKENQRKFRMSKNEWKNKQKNRQNSSKYEKSSEEERKKRRMLIQNRILQDRKEALVMQGYENDWDKYNFGNIATYPKSGL